MATPHQAELGFGASGAWAMRWFSPRRAETIIAEALSLGIRHFDTAGFYARGQAEPRLARALALGRERVGLQRDDLVISTKVGKKIGKGRRLIRDYGAEAVEREVLASCRALGVEAIDIVYVHGPNKHELSSALSGLLPLKDKGLVKAIGICTDGEGLFEAATQPNVDVVMGRYNLLNKTHGPAFASAKEHGKTTIAISPLGQALWRKRFFVPTRPSEAWYLARALMRGDGALRAARRAQFLHDTPGWRPAELMVAYLASDPLVDTLITTTTRPENLAEVAGAMKRPLPDDLRAALGAQAADTAPPP